MITNLYQEIEILKAQLQKHEMYSMIRNTDDLSHFMDVHSYAVWDFMSLLKRLQVELTCISIPWSPSRFSKKAVRLINEIVLAEESDECPIEIHIDGCCDHFTMYLNAMKEVGLSTDRIDSLTQDPAKLIPILPENIKKFVSYHINLSLNGSIEDVAASFLFGRERLLPELFEKVLESIHLKNLKCPSLVYYLERHIEIDGDEHSHMALALFEELCPDDSSKKKALETAKESLILRGVLWDQVVKQLREGKSSLANI